MIEQIQILSSILGCLMTVIKLHISTTACLVILIVSQFELHNMLYHSIHLDIPSNVTTALSFHRRGSPIVEEIIFFPTMTSDQMKNTKTDNLSYQRMWFSIWYRTFLQCTKNEQSNGTPIFHCGISFFILCLEQSLFTCNGSKFHKMIYRHSQPKAKLCSQPT